MLEQANTFPVSESQYAAKWRKRKESWNLWCVVANICLLRSPLTKESKYPTKLTPKPLFATQQVVHAQAEDLLRARIADNLIPPLCTLMKIGTKSSSNGAPCFPIQISNYASSTTILSGLPLLWCSFCRAIAISDAILDQATSSALGARCLQLPLYLCITCASYRLLLLAQISVILLRKFCSKYLRMPLDCEMA